tara:strand:- start:3120 stop:3431 length:312 start_codon:yes stop_codon:yes gene_type:complete
MYKVNDKVIFNVSWMKMPVVGYIEQINGSQVHCRLSVPMMGRTHENVRIDTLKPTEELIKQRDQERANAILDILPKGNKKSISQLVEDLTNAKKIRLQKKYGK